MTTATTTNGVRYNPPRRRRPDVFDRLFGTALVGAFIASVLVVGAIGSGAAWLIVWFWQDIMRRLGG